MVDLTDNQIDAALARGEADRRRETRATKVWYDPELKCVIVELENGRGFSFPARLAQGLEAAADEELAEVEILGDGYGLHWEALDVNVSVTGMMAAVG